MVLSVLIASATPPEAAPVVPPFVGVSRPLSEGERATMTGTSHREGCPLSLDALVMLELTHHGFDGAVKQGRLVVAATVAKPVIEAFRAAYDEGFAIERMEPVSTYDGDDVRSMNANNTSAYNCRPVTGGTRWSEHSHGNAIDINPAQNPYISASGKTVLPKAARAHVDRAIPTPGLLSAHSALVVALKAQGWGWGGDWSRTRDYQHLSASGR